MPENCDLNNVEVGITPKKVTIHKTSKLISIFKHASATSCNFIRCNVIAVSHFSMLVYLHVAHCSLSARNPICFRKIMNYNWNVGQIRVSILSYILYAYAPRIRATLPSHLSLELFCCRAVSAHFYITFITNAHFEQIFAQPYILRFDLKNIGQSAPLRIGFPCFCLRCTEFTFAEASI